VAPASSVPAAPAPLRPCRTRVGVNSNPASALL
jgi:hypothetical protein